MLRKCLKAFYSVLLIAQRALCEEVLVLGDSHTWIYARPVMRKHFPFHYLNAISVGGATVSGLENPNSKTQALVKYREALNSSKAKTVIIQLGEVDVGFVIWYRAAKYQIPVEQMYVRALANYQKLLAEIRANRRVICVSVPLPTIGDGQTWGEIANERKGVEASQRERTDLTLRFNRGLKAFCEKQDIIYLDLDEVSLGADGYVAPQLLNKNPLDHHYDKKAYASLLVPALRPHL